LADGETEKKPQGWWTKHLQQVEKNSNESIALLTELKAVLVKDKQLQGLLNHPLLTNYEAYDKRVKQIEQLLMSVSRDVNAYRAELKQFNQRLSSLEQRRTRGA
jgi:hypothetical protein